MVEPGHLCTKQCLAAHRGSLVEPGHLYTKQCLAASQRVTSRARTYYVH